MPGSSQVGEGSAPLVTEQPRQATDVDTATMVMSSADVVANNGGPVEYEGEIRNIFVLKMKIVLLIGC